MANRDKNKTVNPHRPNGWGFLTNVGIQAINKGQFLLFCVFILLLVLIARLPEDEIAVFLKSLVLMFMDLRMLGWIFSFILALILIWSNRTLRKAHTLEIKRISDEKKELQNELLRRRTGTSLKQ